MALCRACGSPASGAFCGSCGAPVAADATFQALTLPIAPAAAATPAIRPGFEAGMFGTPISGPGAQYVGLWNWGAFLLTPYWLMNHRRPWRGILALVLGPIPFAGLAMPIAYGIVGNRVAVNTGRFADDAQFVAVQNAWRNWGFWIGGLALAFFIFAESISALTGSGTSR